MDNKEKRIWQYLDGDLSQKSRLEVEQKIAADAGYKAHFDDAKKLHAGLGKLPMETAPDEMLSTIMSSIAKEKIYVAQETSFSGLKFFLMGFGGLNAIVLAVLLASGGSASTTNYKWSDFLGKLTAPLQGMQYSLPEAPTSLMPFGLALGLMVMLFWADQLGNRIRPSKRKV